MTMVNLDSRKLRYFAAVIEHGSFAQAASILNITQPALSIAIKTLEHELSAELIDRKVKPISATAFGELVYKSALSFRAESERLQRELRDIANLDNGSVSVKFGVTFPHKWILETHHRIRKTFPNFSLRIEMGGYTNSIDQLLNGDIDLIFSQLPANQSDSRVAHKQILTDKFEVVCSSSHPLLKIKNPTISDLNKYPWVSGGPFEAFLPGWSSIFLKNNLTPPEAIVHTMTSTITHTLLKERSFLAMLPVKSIEPDIKNGQFKNLKIPELCWEQVQGVSWATNRSMPPSVKHFLDSFCESNI